ncbi:GPI-anchored surface protein, putative [Bodo saltans]|uniref:GPI-anchored surface protein, putative n=1 Tax=Bodo saltans TaxID=75058 RepID=A0A0S4JRG7_BODSA|nr:GPI-anchored surface protein, putative [Bodo saltans]|eukprot:CUG94133.1 GPI-anchored surface protein, putative [Bodo saltans]
MQTHFHCNRRVPMESQKKKFRYPSSLFFMKVDHCFGSSVLRSLRLSSPPPPVARAILRFLGCCLSSFQNDEKCSTEASFVETINSLAMSCVAPVSLSPLSLIGAVKSCT